jgi:hypothetical protein
MNNCQNLIKLSLQYFELFNEHNIDGLKNIYESDIELIDWVVNKRGLEEVLKINKELFDMDISVNVYSIECSDNVTTNTLEVSIGDETLKVVDKITWSNNLKIKKIEAFKYGN